MVVSLKFWREPVPDAAEDMGIDRSVWIGTGDQVAVIARVPGYAPAKSRPITLNPDTEEEVTLKLAIPASVSGRVVDSLSKEGIAGARGNLTDVDSFTEGNNGAAPVSFVTDESGYFTLNSLPASTYVMAIKADGYADYNGWQGRGRINLSTGGETALGDIVMLQATSVIGRVLDAETNDPIAGANVELRKPRQWGGMETEATISDEEGAFRISDVEPGSYSLKVRAEAFAMVLFDGVTVEVGSIHDTGDIKLERGLSLRGTVTGPDNEPLEGVKIELREPPSGSFDFGGGDKIVASGVTNKKGEFELLGVSEGKWDLEAELEGFAKYTDRIEVDTRPDTLEIRMSRGGTIRGRLLDGEGNPVAETFVAATSHSASSYGLFKSQPATMVGLLLQEAAVSANTDADGVFVLTNVPEDTYVVSTFMLDSQSLWKDNVRVQDNREVDIGDIRPAAPGSLQVTVTEDGAPVGEVEIRLASGAGFMGAGEVRGVTDSMGVVLIEKVPAGTWYVRTSRDQSQFDTELNARRVTVKAGETTEFKLELRPKDGVFLHGRVTMNGKASITDIILIGTGERADVMKSINPIEGGYYEIVGLKTGSYVMHVREGDKHVTGKVKLELKEEGDFPFNRDFRGYSVRGTVVTPEDSVAQRSSVSVSISHLNPERPEFSTWLRGTTTCAADGAFEFTNVTPGEYQVTATLDGVGTTKTQVTINSADSGALSLSISANSGSIKVTISKLNGAPVSGGGFAMLTLLDSDGATVDLGESFQGFFMLSEGSNQTMPNVPPGAYTVLVRGSGYLLKTVEAVAVETGKTTDVEAELFAAAELYLTVTNTEIDQAALNAASVRYFDAQGQELTKDNNPFDSMSGGTPPENPTLIAKYIGPEVAEVRIKLTGYAEIIVPVTFEQGKKIEKQESLLAE